MNIFLRTAIGLLLPSVCPGCSSATRPFSCTLCNICRGSLLSSQIPAPAASRNIPIILSCAFYTGIARAFIHHIKYHNGSNSIPIIDELIKRVFDRQCLPVKPDLVIPVPLHLSRYRTRGFNQTVLISSRVSLILSAPLRGDILLKTRETQPQTSLPGYKRRTNLKKAFTVSSPDQITGKNIILVDDVMTTGTTLDTCASELITAGARSVNILTMARTIYL